VTALGNQRSASLDQLAQANGIKATYTDFGRMAADPEIDAVVNALPNYLHAPVSIQMLQAFSAREQGADGKPVDKFKIEVNEAGQMTVNGKPM